MKRYISWALPTLALFVAGGIVWQTVAPNGSAATAGTPLMPLDSQIAQAAPAQMAPRREGDDMVMGSPDAPITMIEYASLTCPHCAAFSTGTFPRLKSEYIDKGLVKFIYRDFPLDGAALQAAMIARCAGPDKFFAFIDAFFGQQPNWLRGNTVGQVMQNLKPLTRLGGMSDADFESCLKNTDVQNAVLVQRQQGEKEFQVDATPTLIINGRKYRGSHEFGDLDQFLRPLAGKV